jgi:hypothetical protein
VALVLPTYLVYTYGVTGETDAHGETPHQRRDRELAELLQESRIALPGVQVLFAFLLVLPFQSRYDRLPREGRGAYLLTLLLSALSAALLIAPASIHRLNFRAHDKEWILRSSHRCVLAGTCTLGLSMAGAVFVVVSALYGMWATVPTVATTLVLAWLWLVLPLQGPRRSDDASDD